MTRFTTFASALAFSLTLAACGGSGSGDTDSTAAAPPVSTPEPTPSAAPAEPAVPDNVFANLPAPYNEASYSVGQRTWRLCAACHLIEDGGSHRVGPNLYGMFGQQVGTMAGFPYSDALLEADFIWTPEQLNEWLTNPSGFLPGNRMTFAGVRRPADRDAVIAYLMVESGWQAPTTEDAATADTPEE